jgi:hypothetical protein
MALSFKKDLKGELEVAEGKPARFEVDVSGGKKPYSYIWKKDGSEIKGADAAKYEIAAVKESDEGN